MPKAKDLFEKASTILGYDLLDKCQNGPKDVLDSTVSAEGHLMIDSRTCHKWNDVCVLRAVYMDMSGADTPVQES